MGKIHISHVRNRNCMGASPRDVRKHESFKRTGGWNICADNQLGDILHLDVFESDVLNQRPFIYIPRHWIMGLNSLVYQVNADKGRRFQHGNIFAGNVLDRKSTPLAALDKNGVLSAGDDAVLK